MIEGLFDLDDWLLNFIFYFYFYFLGVGLRILFFV